MNLVYEGLTPKGVYPDFFNLEDIHNMVGYEVVEFRVPRLGHGDIVIGAFSGQMQLRYAGGQDCHQPRLICKTRKEVVYRDIPVPAKSNLVATRIYATQSTRFKHCVDLHLTLAIRKYFQSKFPNLKFALNDTSGIVARGSFNLRTSLQYSCQDDGSLTVSCYELPCPR